MTGTPIYMSPEMFLSIVITSKYLSNTDVWLVKPKYNNYLIYIIVKRQLHLSMIPAQT